MQPFHINFQTWQNIMDYSDNDKRDLCILKWPNTALRVDIQYPEKNM